MSRFRSNKVRALLVYLALSRGQPVLRTTVSALLWPNYEEEAARVNLRQTVAALRSNLAPYELLDSDRNYIHLRLDPVTVWCDARLVEELLARCQQHDHPSLSTCTTCQPQVQQAGALYRGLLLDNFPEIDSSAFAQWLQSQRTYFADRLAAVQRPLVPTPKPRGKLTPLIGRTEEIAALTRQLRHTAYRCISLVGLGGIGKSRLACAVGEQLQADFPDGVWLVELSGLAPATDAESAEALHGPGDRHRQDHGLLLARRGPPDGTGHRLPGRQNRAPHSR